MKLTTIPALIAIIPLLGACAGLFKRPEPSIVYQTQYVPVVVPASFYSRSACPSWPAKADYVTEGVDQEASDYDFAAYQAYRCERATRLAAGERQTAIIADVEARNPKEK